MLRSNGVQIEPSQVLKSDGPCCSGRSIKFETLQWNGSADTLARQAGALPALQHSRARGTHRDITPLFELSESCCAGKRPSVGRLLVRRPIAVLAVIPKPAVLFTAGAVAGAIGMI
jgi:hypothetical protein